MFFYSMRATTVKFFAVVCVALVTLITLITFVPTYTDPMDTAVSKDSTTINYEKIKTNDERVDFSMTGDVVLFHGKNDDNYEKGRNIPLQTLQMPQNSARWFMMMQF